MVSKVYHSNYHKGSQLMKCSNLSEKLVVHQNGSLRQAMQTIDKNKAGIAVVVDDGGRTVGLISDGDIRRALLKGHNFSDNVTCCMNQKFVSVAPGTPRADVLDIMRARFLRQMPIIDEEGFLHGIQTYQKILGGEPRDNWAVILAGGKGTRLGKLTRNTPKPMLPVAGRPILERLILHLVGFGIRRIFLSVNHLKEIVKDYFGEGQSLGCRIQYLDEDEPLGTGGPLSLLPEPPKAPVVVLNGDLITQTDINAMLELHCKNKNYATMGIRKYIHEVAYGCVEIDDNGFLVEMEEKPLLEKNINAGIYVLSPEAIESVPNAFYPITEVFKVAMQENKRCGVYHTDGEWIDVGQPHHLFAARGEI
jgi:dTDP-glucose pyrophosphorylase